MADSLVNFIAKILKPLFRPFAKQLARPKKGSTWHYEAVTVAIILIITAVLTSPSLSSVRESAQALKEFCIIWLSAAAVFGSFLHAQVGTYMAEDMSISETPLTPCYTKLGEYWVYKEILWFLVFFISGAYPAIAGNIIFLLFPAWRKIYKEERQESQVLS
ncbi:MAG: hypothetical protein JWN64_799 [Parcubacteria group bacterium]|nr:hypothetical protein [Parcubacteria group bacterium]